MGEPVYVARQPIPGTPYVYLQTVGVGGHGTVYEVEHTFLKKRAMMKVLHAEHGEDDDLVRRTTDEARILARIEHPNIVRAHDGGMTAEVPPRAYFVMDALQGLVLHKALKAAPQGLGFAMSTQIVLGVLDGLAFAHTEHKVIHRDIKPANIFIHRTPTDTTVPKILDFGIAHFVQKRQRHTGRGFLGTPRYTAPEQIRGERPTARTDLYAVGLVLYECLTGRDPFADVREYPALIHAHLNVVPRPIADVMDGVPNDLDSLVTCMLAKDPAARPESAAATAIVLRMIKERLDQQHIRVLNKPEFRTEPTPLDNTLITTAAKEATEPPSEPPPADAASINDTTPGAPPFTDVMRRVVHTEPLAAGGLDPTVEQRAPPVDRNAPTRASREPVGAQPKNGTMKVGPEAEDSHTTSSAPAITETPLVSSTPVARTPVPRMRPGEVPRGPRSVLSARGAIVAAAALAVGVALGLSARFASRHDASPVAGSSLATAEPGSPSPTPPPPPATALPARSPALEPSTTTPTTSPATALLPALNVVPARTAAGTAIARGAPAPLAPTTASAPRSSPPASASARRPAPRPLTSAGLIDPASVGFD